MYYVVHHDEFFGKLFAPDVLFGYMGPLKLLSWMTVVIELAAPLTLWWSDRSRKGTLIFLILFHMGTDVAMNLEFFHWIMAVGWASFFAQPIQRDKFMIGRQNGGSLGFRHEWSCSEDSGLELQRKKDM